MIKIEIIIFGKLKNNMLKELVGYYTNLVNHSIKLEILQLKDNSDKKISIKQIPVRDKIILISEHGKEYDSFKFKKMLMSNIESYSEISFVLGNAFGFEKEVLNKFNKIALSKLTTTHELALVIILEQIYRSYEIRKGSKYHK